MAKVCDACGTKYKHDDGETTLRVSPPSMSHEMLMARVDRGLPYAPPMPSLDVDLCIQCTSKVLAILGMPTEICELPQLPPAPPPPSEPSNAGALTDDDLRKLGLLDPGVNGGS
jgi:hypothetical protein